MCILIRELRFKNIVDPERFMGFKILIFNGGVLNIV